jgi:hypothetical protein
LVLKQHIEFRFSIVRLFVWLVLVVLLLLLSLEVVLV